MKRPNDPKGSPTHPADQRIPSIPAQDPAENTLPPVDYEHPASSFSPDRSPLPPVDYTQIPVPAAEGGILYPSEEDLKEDSSDPGVMGSYLMVSEWWTREKKRAMRSAAGDFSPDGEDLPEE